MEPHLLPQHIIAIGASAGAVEPLYAFFDNTPPDQVSYVVVQHMSPDHQSHLTELLAKHSRLQVCTAEQGQLVKENQVYVIPNKAFLTIRGGKLQLTEKRGRAGPHRTVNTFFTSLAVDQKEKAIGVILSGTGTDGGDGIRAIKQAGGLVLVQDPATAAYEDMPTNAIATGIVDAVLAPAALPAAIREYVLKKSAIALHRPIQEEKEESDMEAILDLIKSRLPLDFSDYKRATIFRRIRKRMAHHKVKHSDQYLALLQKDTIELEALAKGFLISVTSFFRDNEAFDLLERDVIPSIIEQSGTREIKIWVAGCATGEEAYSIAILFQEYLDKHKQHREIKLFATDLDKAALAVAAKGNYPATIKAQVPPASLQRFFTRVGETYQVIPALRKMLIFSQHDLGRNPPYCHVDLISCRNVLIYLNPVLQTKIFRMLHFGLQKGGYLFLGSSENAMVLKPYVKEISKRWKMYQKTDHSRPAVFETFALPVVEECKLVPLPLLQPAELLSQKNNLSDLINGALLGEYGQAGVCVDKSGQVLQSFGDLSPYLLPKVFNLKFAELLPEPLAIAFGAAEHRAFKDDQRVEIKGIRLDKPAKNPAHETKSSTATREIALLVIPFTDPKNQQKRLLVLMREETSLPSAHTSEWFDPGEHTREYVLGMEEEHRETKESLQAAQERLEASQENMLSFNEELLSANEEMQSANEELQSVNEELQTVNNEHQLKIRELTELNDDLNNYFRSNVNGQLFVDKNLLLKKFSSAAQVQINIRESDIGRPLHEITTNIKLETLIEDIKAVISLGTIILKEVQSTDGKWYQVKTMPYIRQSDNQQDGAIISFHDVSELKQYQHEIDQSNARLRRTNVDLDSFVYMASHDLRAPIINLEGLVGHLVRSLAEKADDTEHKMLSLTTLSVNKLKKTINDLTEVVKAQQGTDDSVEFVNVAELLKELKQDLDGLADDGVLTTDLAVPLLAYNRKHLRSILYNLLSNALKYRSPQRPPRIRLTTERWGDSGKGVRISVVDNGLGLEAKQLKKLFTMCIRFHPEVEGTGLGLYTIKRLIENQGGNIHVESTPNQGTTFRIELPPPFR